MPLTDKKRRYAEARLAGQGKKAAAIAAGCPEKTAAQAGSRYEKDADVVAHMQRLNAADAGSRLAKAVNRPQKPPEPQNPDDLAGEDQPSIMEFQEYKDPLEFLELVMHDIGADPRLRVDAAKSLAAFKHAKPGVGGKKGEKQAAAQQASKGRFGAQPPPLKAVK